MIRSERKHPTRRGARCAGGIFRQGLRGTAPTERRPSERQLASIRTVMRLFVEDDLANGIAAGETRHCGGCCCERPAPGFIRYGDRAVCNDCATAYEIARVSGDVTSLDTYLRRG